MALPTTISSVTFPANSHYLGPFKSSSGNFYMGAVDSSDTSIIEIHKATDPTSSFTEQDSASKPNLVNNVTSLWIFQVSDILHISAQETITGRVSYHTFNMSTDAWGTVNETIESPADVPSVEVTSIGVRSDGDRIVLYQGDKDNVKGSPYDRVDYARNEGAGWTVGVAVDNGSNINWIAGTIVPGSSDRMHFFFQNDTSREIHQRTLNSANSLQTFPASFDTSVGSATIIPSHGAHYSSGGQEKVRCLYHDSTNKASIAKLDSADAPTVSTDVDISDNTVSFAGNVMGASLTNNGTDLHLLYADATGSDVYRDVNSDDAGWGTDSLVETTSASLLSANFYTRSGNNKIAYLYPTFAGTDIIYNEVDLGAAAVDTSLVTPSRLRRHMAALLGR